MIYGAAIALAALGAFAGYQTVRLKICEADRAEIKSAYLLLADRVSQQNDAIKAWEARAVERERRASEALVKAREQRAKSREEIDRLRAMAVVTALDAQSARTCAAAVDEVRKTLGP